MFVQFQNKGEIIGRGNRRRTRVGVSYRQKQPEQSWTSTTVTPMPPPSTFTHRFNSSSIQHFSIICTPNHV